MADSTKKRATGKAKVVVDKNMRDYANDPFFIKKRETAEQFLKKAGLPKSFAKTKSK
ncbi:MAG: hypothetical protein ABI675_00070 [Chitinophagaceae bacterium]